MIDPLDRRRNAIRDDLADIRLRDRVERPAYAEPRRRAVRAAHTRCLLAPGGTAVETEFLYGEPVDVFDVGDGTFVEPDTDDAVVRQDRWSWVQSAVDGYVGYVETRDLGEPGPPATHVVAVPAALVREAPGSCSALRGPLPLGAIVRVREIVERAEVFVQSGQLAQDCGTEHGPLALIDDGTFVLAKDLRPIEERPEDWVAIAEQFLGVPYLWGGKTAAGIDCSGLVQVALRAAGVNAPRDSDMQAAELGEALPPDALPQRGDLVFWKGHVGIMASESRLLHANGYHRATVFEPVAETIARLDKQGLPVTVRRRLGAPGAAPLLPRGTAAQ